ncbi:MAG TPA: hypothetical protein VGB75_13350 [Jatrophihabitans sp.]|jgi:hypothetical protein|uniref:hypothetical protein n=1 Tax=Jatrophihabitans sp. TaxID=1932789 RepID=UPI002F08B29B
MDHNNPGQAQRPVGRGALGLKLGLVAAGLAVGAIGATAITAGAEPGASAAPSASASATAPGSQAPDSSADGDGHRGGRGHGSAPVRGDEKAVTEAQSAALKAAALKAVPGGTVYRVETDAGDAAFEAHMTKADGSEVTVKFDEKLAVIEVEDGMGKGDPDSDE